MTEEVKEKLSELLRKLKKKKDPNSVAIGDEVETKLIKGEIPKEEEKKDEKVQDNK